MESFINIVRFILSHPLARKNKWGALKRFFSYQISIRLTPFPIIYPFTQRTKLIVERGMTGATGNIYCGLHEFEDMGFLLHFLRPEDLFVDVGANIGSYTILASGHVGCRTIAFEPIRSTFDRLRNNMAINFLEDKVVANNMGVGSKKEILKFTTSLDTVNHVAVKEEVDFTEEVQIVTLDEMLGKGTPILIKMDVEGFETEVIRGADRTLANPLLKAIIIELNGSGNKYGFDDKDVHQFLITKDFKPYAYNPFTRLLSELNLFGEANTIYIRDIEVVKERVRNSNTIQISGVSF